MENLEALIIQIRFQLTRKEAGKQYYSWSILSRFARSVSPESPLIQTDFGDYTLSKAYDLMCTVLHTSLEGDTALDLYTDDIES